MTFPGFTESDFDIFTIPDFGARMGAIRAELRPKLLAVGEELAPQVARLVTGPVVAHTAAHMRRRTNPPPATWVAFGRSAKGYKRYVHFRVAINQAGLSVTVHIEDDSDDKASFAAALCRNRDALLDGLSREAELVWYSLRNGEPEERRAEAPITGAALTGPHLDSLAQTLSRFKTADFSAGIPMGRDDPRLRSPVDLPPLLLSAMRRLSPLYEAALP